jgi:uncharacterized membrane-anchored protein
VKFTLIKKLSQDKSMRPILSALLLFTLLYILSDILVKYVNFGIFPDAINVTLFGDEEQYIDPLSTSAFLEFWHMEIFFIMMILLTLSAVFVRVSKDDTSKIILLSALMICALFSLISLVLAFFLAKTFVLIYVILFFIWHAIAVYMILYSLGKLYYDKSI